MKTNAIDDTGRTSKALSAVSRAFRSSFFGLFGAYLFILWDNSALGTPSVIAILALITILALAALVASAWYAFRARADRQWRAVLDRYTEQEEKKITISRRNPHAHPQP